MPKILKEKALLEKPIIPNRLLQPFLNESIAHILMNPLAEVKTNATEIKFLNYLEDKKKYEPDWTIRELEDKIVSLISHFSSLEKSFRAYQNWSRLV